MTAEQKKLLLQVARENVSATARGSKPPQHDKRITDIPCGGVFVTLRNKGQLRGCMGTFSPEPDLVVTIQKTAISASRDPRFTSRPVLPEELSELNIEISILSLSEKTSDPLSLEVGRHGILIENPAGRGCFLPQVASEMRWDQQEFLSRCCKDKAHLPPDAWKDPSTNVFLFTADVFSET